MQTGVVYRASCWSVDVNYTDEPGDRTYTVMINLYKVAKKSGVGIRRNAEMLHLILPQGAGRLYPRAKVVASGSTVRSMAAEVVIVPPQG